MRAYGALALLVLLLPLTACSNFFSCEKASCPASSGTGTGTGTGTTPAGDFAYVANSSAGATSLSEYNVGGGTLSSLGTIALGYIPAALAVAPSNGFLYVASVPGAMTPGIYLYKIGSTGALTVANGGNVLAIDTVAAMAISPDGNWLYTVNADGQTLTQYSVDTASGGISSTGATALPIATCLLGASTPASQSCSVAVSPSGQYVVVSLNTAGDVVYSYARASGISGNILALIPSGFAANNPTGDFSVVLDASNNAYIARTSSVAVYGLSVNGVTGESSLAYASGSLPRSITLSTNDKYVYTADEGASTISGFQIGNGGSLAEVANSPFAAPANVSALGVDNTGTYLLGVGYDAKSGVQLYSIASTGVLSPVAAAGSGTNASYPALVAMTH